MRTREPRTRRPVSRRRISVLRALGWRYSPSRDAWVHRAFGGRYGPVFQDVEAEPHIEYVDETLPQWQELLERAAPSYPQPPDPLDEPPSRNAG